MSAAHLTPNKYSPGYTYGPSTPVRPAPATPATTITPSKHYTPSYTTTPIRSPTAARSPHFSSPNAQSTGYTYPPVTPPRPLPTPPRFVSAPSTPTGSWRHPAMDAVTRRTAQRAFTDASFRKLAANAVALALAYFGPWVLGSFDTLAPLRSLAPTWAPYVLNALRLLFVWNLYDPLSRLLRPADDFTDLPLTPSQRRLLGLDPSTPSSAKPEEYVTPPRYVPSAHGASASVARRSAPSPASGAGAPPSPSPSRFGGGGLGDSVGAGMGGGLGGSVGGGLGGSGGRRGMLEKRGNGSPLVGLGSASPQREKAGASVTPGSRWAYEKAAMQRKGGLRMPSFV